MHFAGFGISRYDIPLLREELKRCDVPFDTENRALIDADIREPYYTNEGRISCLAYRSSSSRDGLICHYY